MSKKKGYALRTQDGSDGRAFTQLVDAATGVAVDGVAGLQVRAAPDGKSNTVTVTLTLANVPTYEEDVPAAEGAAEAAPDAAGGPTGSRRTSPPAPASGASSAS